MLHPGAEDLLERPPCRWSFLHALLLWVGAEQEWHLGDKIPLKERPLEPRHAWSCELTGVINIPSRSTAAGVMPTRAARLCAQTFWVLDLATGSVKMQNAACWVSCWEEWIFLSAFWPSLTGFAPRPQRSAPLCSFRRGSARDAGPAGSTAGLASASTSRFIPTAEWTAAMSPTSWVSLPLHAQSSSTKRLDATLLYPPKFPGYVFMNVIPISWNNNGFHGSRGVKYLSTSHQVDEPRLCPSGMLAGRLFVEVTGAALRHRDERGCKSAWLTSQQRDSTAQQKK